GLSSTLIFFFQPEDCIRDSSVTGVQTCALPISGVPERGARRMPPRLNASLACPRSQVSQGHGSLSGMPAGAPVPKRPQTVFRPRSGERRGGKGGVRGRGGGEGEGSVRGVVRRSM